MQAGRSRPPKGGLRGHAGRALSEPKTRARDIVMAKPTKPSRGRRPIRKASRASRKTAGPKAAAGAKKAARKGVAAPRKSAVAAPRAATKRAAASVRSAHSAAPPSRPVPRAGEGRVRAAEGREGHAKTSPVKWVYAFGGGKAEGGSGMRDLLGGKGANLAEMANLGLPVPPGFTITTEVCGYFYSRDKT